VGNGYIALCILNLALDGGEWSASRPDRFNHGTHSEHPYLPCQF